MRTCVKFAFANKIEAMYERSQLQLCKRKRRNSLNNAVRFSPPQIVPVRKFGMKVSFFFQVLALKLSK